MKTLAPDVCCLRVRLFFFFFAVVGLLLQRDGQRNFVRQCENDNNWIGIISHFQVYIVGHIPPGSDERDQAASLTNGHQFFSQKNNLRYLELVRKYSSIIQGQFFGHLHSDSFRIVYNDQGEWGRDKNMIFLRRSVNCAEDYQCRRLVF